MPYGTCIIIQTLLEREAQVGQLHEACEDISREKKRRSIAVSDMDNEVVRLHMVSIIIQLP